MVTYVEIAKMIDHSLLKPTLTDQEIKEGCEVAARYKVASVCVRPSDIKAVTDAAHRRNILVKVIFENCYLTEDEFIAACRICNEVGVDFVKTSTGYGTGGAEDKDIRLMRKYADPKIQIEAAGGVRTLERAIEIRELSCTRFGCTATVGILERLQ